MGFSYMFHSTYLINYINHRMVYMSLSDKIIISLKDPYAGYIPEEDVKQFIKLLKEAFNVNKTLYPVDIINDLAGSRLI